MKTSLKVLCQLLKLLSSTFSEHSFISGPTLEIRYEKKKKTQTFLKKVSVEEVKRLILPVQLKFKRD